MFRTLLLEYGFKPKVILLLRDPAERIWSGVRHKRRDVLIKGRPSQDSEENHLLKVYRSDAIQIRSDYESAVQSLKRVFLADEIHIELYERLFTSEAFAKISSFLNISDLPDPAFSSKSNSSPKLSMVSNETLRLVAREYADTYRFALDEFGSDIRTLWPYCAIVLDG